MLEAFLLLISAVLTGTFIGTPLYRINAFLTLVLVIVLGLWWQDEHQWVGLFDPAFSEICKGWAIMVLVGLGTGWLFGRLLPKK